MTRPLNIKQLFEGNGNHKLVHDDGRETPLAGYTQIVMLDGWVSYTAYYGREEGICTPEEFCKLIAINTL